MKSGVVKVFGFSVLCLWMVAVTGCGGGSKPDEKRGGVVGTPGVSGAAGEQRGSSVSGKEDVAGVAPAVSADVQAPPEPEADEPPPQTTTRDAQNAEVLVGQPALFQVLTARESPQQPPPEWKIPAEDYAKTWLAYFSKQQAVSNDVITRMIGFQPFFVATDQDWPWYVDFVWDTSVEGNAKISPIRYFHGMFSRVGNTGQVLTTGYYVRFKVAESLSGDNQLLDYYAFVFDDYKGEGKALGKGVLLYNTQKAGLNGLLVSHLAVPTVQIKMAVGKEVRDAQGRLGPGRPGEGPYNLLMMTIDGPQFGSQKLGKLFLKRHIEEVSL